MTMKNILTFLLIIAASQTQASWSGFAHVTPENQKKYGVHVKITTVKNKKSYRVEFNIRGSGHKHAWLVIASSPLTEKEQKLRSSIWFKKPINNKMISITKLKPSVKNRYKEILNTCVFFTLTFQIRCDFFYPYVYRKCVFVVFNLN